ncbi:UNVERIFIED_CONTAM: Retrovirus-related Pol polyprotein from transposon RE1 [Sesamum radiatum]|uniref:Retrovirus-related Pol polyprotein from transposon RE1 n=1 Tax=Sesamum radiatum TaxID=300843 RepID=A0AAW2TXA8_SESRA
MHQKAYKLYDLDADNVLFSRDVQFYEHVFPFANSSSTPSHIPLPLVPLHSDTNPSLTADIEPSMHQSLSSSTPTSPEPKTYSEAVEHQEWRDAMKAEIGALEHNNTWQITPLPAGKRPIGCKWVFKTKLRADGSVERYKARLVAKGFTQIEGLDYTDSFSPVAKTVTVRLFFAFAAAQGWPLQQMDVNNAFLHGHLDEDLYMTPPEGYSVAPGMVCKLQRSLYGLKQASRQWNVELTVKLKEFGFLQSAHDHCLFTKRTAAGLMALMVYVDDILVTGPCLEDIDTVKDYLHNLFTIKDMGDARYFLGLEIARSSTGIYVAQTKYVLDIVSDAGLSRAKSASTPLPLGLKLTADCGALLVNPDSYRRSLVNILIDLVMSIGKAALHIVRYLKGSPTLGLFFPSNSNFELTAYCDADWASCPDSRRSLTGFCIFIGGALVSWKTKKQSTVSRSTAEAEYRSMAATVCELRWISYVLSDFGISVPLPIRLFCDNQAALHIMANPVFHERTKHIEIDCHVVRNAYKEDFIAPSHVRSSLQLADLFTKILPLKSFADLVSKLGLFSMAPTPTCGGAVEIGDADDAAAGIYGSRLGGSYIYRQMVVALVVKLMGEGQLVTCWSSIKYTCRGRIHQWSLRHQSKL